ncbi:hypothetical protein VNF293_15920 [Atlantibacter hermannii]
MTVQYGAQWRTGMKQRAKSLPHRGIMQGATALSLSTLKARGLSCAYFWVKEFKDGDRKVLLSLVCAFGGVTDGGQPERLLR